MMAHDMGVDGGWMMANMGGGMMVFLLIYLVVVVVFLWLMYRGVVAVERIADRKHSETKEE